MGRKEGRKEVKEEGRKEGSKMDRMKKKEFKTQRNWTNFKSIYLLFNFPAL